MYQNSPFSVLGSILSFSLFICGSILVKANSGDDVVGSIQEIGTAENESCDISVPILSLTDLSSNNAQTMMSALNNTGTFYLKDHGISAQVIDDAMNALKTFFSYSNDLKSQIKIDENQRGWLHSSTLSESAVKAKMKYTNITDFKQVLFFGPRFKPNDPDIGVQPLVALNQWPAFMPQLPAKIYPYYNQVMRVGDIILESIAIGLGLEQHFFKQYYTKPLGRGQLLYYPIPIDRETQVYAVGPHTDFGVITVLLQDDNGGLQFYSRLQQKWIDVKPIDGTLIINIGDILEKWSAFKLKSTVHRVVNRNRTRKRYGIAIFYDCNSDTLIDAHNMVKEDDANIENLRFVDTFLAGQYIDNQNRKMFAHYQDARFEESRKSVQNDLV